MCATLVQVQSYSPRDGNGVSKLVTARLQMCAMPMPVFPADSRGRNDAAVHGSVTNERRIGITFNYQL